MMMVIISIVIPTVVLHQALHCGFLAGTCFVLCTFFSTSCPFHRKEEERECRGGVWNLVIYSHIVSKGPARIHFSLTAEPLMASASQSFGRLSRCGILGGATGNSTQDTDEESGSGFVKFLRHEMIAGSSLCRICYFQPVDSHS